MTAWRFIVGVVSLGFVVRYVITERRLSEARTRAIAMQTREELAPWRAWTEWRKHIIEAEHAAN